MKNALVILLSLVSSAAAFAQGETPPPPPPSSEGVAVAEVPASAPASIVSDRSIGVHVAANIGLFEVDAQYGHFYAFAAGNLGVPILTDGATGFGMAGLGYSIALSSPGESMWYLDLMALGTAGRTRTDNAIVGGGLGLGFRYLHRSGFTFSTKVPIFGATAEPVSAPFSGFNGAQSLSTFYLASLISLPVVSIGYRF